MMSTLNMDMLSDFDIGNTMGGAPVGAATASNWNILSGNMGQAAMVATTDDNIRCNRCGFAGCDVKILGCGCVAHA